MVNRILHFLFLTCKKQTEFIEEQPQNRLRKIQMYMHFRMCKLCRVYDVKVKWMDAKMSEQLKSYCLSQDNIVDIELFKMKLKKRLEK